MYRHPWGKLWATTHVLYVGTIWSRIKSPYLPVDPFPIFYDVQEMRNVCVYEKSSSNLITLHIFQSLVLDENDTSTT